MLFDRKMLWSLFGFENNEEREEGEKLEDSPPDEQQGGGLQQLPEEADRFNQVPLGTQTLRAVWDEQGTASSGAGGFPSQSAKQGTARTSPNKEASIEEETSEERSERRRLEGTENIVKSKLVDKPLNTIAEAMDYCQSLVELQIQRANEKNTPMNTAVYGDSHARKAIMTLLPDAFIRDLFLNTTRLKDAWPRIRTLFGAPPFNFLKPEDAGLIRAEGIAWRRVNMTYDTSKEVASYSQFGESHLVDDFLRQYRVLPQGAPRSTDHLPCDIERIDPSTAVLFNVRVCTGHSNTANLYTHALTLRAARFAFVASCREMCLFASGFLRGTRKSAPL